MLYLTPVQHMLMRTLWNHSRPTEKYLIKEIKEQLLHSLKEKKKKVCIVVVVPTKDS